MATNADEAAALIECGIIMPISATENFTEGHWADVLTLLHRGVSAAGFTPRNVWDNTVKDRISERIIGNIFSFPIMIADVSDLNPNVMFELGLRLASKKPTIVIQNSGGRKAFDIADFHTFHYPSDLNYLKMEVFLNDMTVALRQKYEASNREDYVPFLGSVIVDVISPDQRELPIAQLLLRRMEDLENTISESSMRPEFNISVPQRVAVASRNRNVGDVEYYFEVPTKDWSDVASRFVALGAMEIISFEGNEQVRTGAVRFKRHSSNQARKNLEKIVENILMKVGGNYGIPSSLLDRADIDKQTVYLREPSDG